MSSCVPAQNFQDTGDLSRLLVGVGVSQQLLHEVVRSLYRQAIECAPPLRPRLQESAEAHRQSRLSALGCTVQWVL